MGGARHCSHDGTMAKKCLLSTQTDGITNSSESSQVNQDQQILDQALATVK